MEEWASCRIILFETKIKGVSQLVKEFLINETALILLE